MELTTFIHGSAHDLHQLADQSVQMIATSPPYYGLRAYAGEQGVEWPEVTFRLNEWVEPTTVAGCDPNCAHEWCDGPVISTGNTPSEKRTIGAYNAGPTKATQGAYCQKCGGWRGGLGMEPSPVAFIGHLILCLREWRRVLRDDGVCFVNLGDSYNSQGGHTQVEADGRANREHRSAAKGSNIPGLKPKDLLMIPAMFAIAARADGWYLRSDCIWAKPNPMPESVTDRPTKAHEYVFLLAKSQRYFWDAEGVKEPATATELGATGILFGGTKYPGKGVADGTYSGNEYVSTGTRNLRTVWNIATQPTSFARAASDYVDGDGKSYKASPDCPVHGHLAGSRSGRRVSRDELLAARLPRTVDTSNDHAQGCAFGLFASSDGSTSNSRHATPDSQSQQNALNGTPNNTHQSRTSADHHGMNVSAQTPDRTSHTSQQDACQPDSSDFPGQQRVPIATDHSTQTSRTGHAPATSQPCTSFDETLGHTARTSVAPESPEMPQAHTDGNNTSADFDAHAQVIESAQMIDHSADTYTSPFVLPPMDDYTCTCTEYKIDHFATWPEKLVEPMIRAGSSERGACPHCGKAWVRVVEREKGDTESAERPKAKGQNGYGKPGSTLSLSGNGSKEWAERGSKVTDLGFLPACTCPAHEPVPCVVLDPFNGSGTTGKVAVQLGRAYVGVDIATEYLDGVTSERFGAGVQIGMGM